MRFMAVDGYTFWNRIDLLRMSKGMTLVELQDRIGFRGAYIYSIKSRNIVPGLDTLWKIADVFGCSIDYLIGRDSETNRKLENRDALPDITAKLIADEKFYNFVCSMMSL